MFKVSIIMPSYNSANFIKKAVDSVLNQSYSEWELIIVDDCSKDDSVKIIEEYSEIDSRIILIKKNVNSGVADSRNLGIKSASGFYLAFLDSDDIWNSEKLKSQVDFMRKNNASISFTQYFRIDSNDTVIKEIQNIPESVTYNDLLKGNSIAMSTSMIEYKKIDGVFFEKIGHEDYYFWLKILRLGFVAYGLRETLVSYRVHQTSLSANKFKAIKYTWFIYKNMLKLNIFETIYYFIIHEFRAIIKRII